MPNRERSTYRADRRTRRLLGALGEEFRDARVALGLSQLDAGRAAGLSRWQVGRMERGVCLSLSFAHSIRLATVLGLELAARLYPAGSPLRDAAHVALLRRFEAMLPKAVVVRREVPLPGPEDRRAWDAVVSFGSGAVGVEAETRLVDAQALVRRIALKARDDPRVDHVVLVVAKTRSNRAVLRAERDAFAAGFPADRAAALAELRAGRTPTGSAIVVL